MSITKKRLNHIIKEELSMFFLEAYDDLDHIPMMPPKPVKPKGIDVPLSKLKDGIAVAREAVMAMYSPSSREYSNAMLVIDMAEEQGMLEEGWYEPHI